MESRFGHPFDDVRIFTDREAAESAVAMGADAYAYGRSIAFAAGQYAPHSDAGRSLLAHELAHVVQQRVHPRRIQRQRTLRAQAFDIGYELYLNPSGTRYHPDTGRYELSDWDVAHLVRRGGFYFLVTERISLITPPEVRRAAAAGAPGSGVLLSISAAEYAAVAVDPDATVAQIVRGQLGITVGRMTHATGASRDFSRPDLPEPMRRSLAEPASDAGAAARDRAARMPQEPTLESAARGQESLPISEIGLADRMDQGTVLRDMSAGARAEWYLQKLGPYQAQIYASAQRHRIPTQLLAVVILNELADINLVDVVQSGEHADWGSLGMAQIQITTAMTENLVDVTPAEAAAAYHEHLRRSGHDHEPGRPLNEYERRVGRRLRTARQLQVPQVAIEAAAREIEILINRMAANPQSPWQRRFNFRAAGAVGDAIYNAVGPPDASEETREGMLALMVSGAYNSPNIIDTGDPQVLRPVPPGLSGAFGRGFRNALVHGTNAQAHAIELRRLGLFRTRGAPARETAPRSRAASSSSAAPAPAPVTGMRFDGSRLTLYGGVAAVTVVAVSGLRASNPSRFNRDHRDHTGPGSQMIAHVGPIPEGSYFVNPSEVQRDYEPQIWGPIRLRIHEAVLTALAREMRTDRDGGFFIHEDVRQDGTAGCIGLQRRRDTLSVFARFAATTEQIPLEVRYPRVGGRRRRRAD